MKYLLGIYTCLIIAVAVVAAQQDAPPKPTPSIQTTAKALMKAQAAADKTLAKRDDAPTEELKKLVAHEIAKSAALPVTTTVQEPVKQIVTPEMLEGLKLEFKSGLVVIDGTVYMQIGSVIMPMSGSGCFLSETENDVRLQRARVKFAEMNKAEPVKQN